MRSQVTLLVGSLTAFVAFSAQAGEFLSASQAKEVVRRLNQTCADTWCEDADESYRFSEVHCDSSTSSCEVIYVVKSLDLSPRVAPAYEATCTVKGLKRYADLAESESRELNSKFYERVGSCIDFGGVTRRRLMQLATSAIVKEYQRQGIALGATRVLPAPMHVTATTLKEKNAIRASLEIGIDLVRDPDSGVPDSCMIDLKVIDEQVTFRKLNCQAYD